MRARRRFSRFEPDDPQVSLRTETGVVRLGDVTNESYGGLGIVCDTREGLEIDMAVTIEVDDVEYDATIVSIRPHTEGGFMIGIQWAGDEEDDEDEEDLDSDDDD